MKNLDFLSLDAKKVAGVVNGLNQLLADLQVYYTNLRGFHWNIKGKGFFILHSKFEELYNDVAEKIDEVAERVLQLDGTPDHRFSSYLASSNVKEVGAVYSGRDAVANILDTLKELIKQERALLEVASKAGDEVTVALLSDYLKSQEKQVWMLVAFSAKRPQDEEK
ncbi:MAG TPA: Dps family protein [Prevotella sp.]